MDAIQKLPNSALIQLHQKKFDTVVLVGNGALKNGWLPLRRVLDQWVERDSQSHSIIKKLRVQNTEALHQLGSLSYRFKIARALLYQEWCHKTRPITEIETRGISRTIQEFLTLRREIGRAYCEAHQELSLKCDPMINNIIGENSAVITTNWDKAILSHPQIRSSVFLHGKCDHPESLVFPTELIIEDIIFELPRMLPELKGCSSSFIHELLSIFRSGTVDALLAAHTQASTLIREASRLVIWGYSLGDFDADINALVGTNINPAVTSELIVINPNPYAFQRAVALTGLTNATHYNPALGSMMKLSVSAP